MPSPALAVMFQCVQCRDTAICWQVSLAFCCFPNVWTAELEFLRFGKKIPKYSTGQLTLHDVQAWRHVIKLELEIFKRCFIDLLQSIFYYCWIYIQKGYLEINRILQKCSMIEVLLFSQIQPSLFFPLILKVKTLVATAISKVKKEVSELFFSLIQRFYVSWSKEMFHR